MAFGMRSKASPYEVRCANCDVSFPVETRTCVHCGGPTGRLGLPIEDESTPFSASDLGVGTPSANPADLAIGYQDNVPIEPVAESPFSLGDSLDRLSSADAPANDRELETNDQPTSKVGSLVRSLGGVIWVILLIGFSLARSCGE